MAMENNSVQKFVKKDGDPVMGEKKVLTPKDEEFKKLFAMMITDISYCEMYPYAPSCVVKEDDEEFGDIVDEDLNYMSELGMIDEDDC